MRCILVLPVVRKAATSLSWRDPREKLGPEFCVFCGSDSSKGKTQVRAISGALVSHKEVNCG